MNVKTEPSVLKAGVIAGVSACIAQTLASYVPGLNMCGCLFIIGAGIFACYLLKKEGAHLTAGMGAKAGAIAGVAMTVVGLLIAVGYFYYMGIDQIYDQIMVELQKQQMPPQQREQMEDMFQKVFDWIKAHAVIAVVVYFIFALFVNTIATVIGGLIGGSIWQNAEDDVVDFAEDPKM
jgi:predicted histidine transporter YuiF (NhaC family)